MKKNKIMRLFAMLLSLVMILSLAACGKPADTETEKSTDAPKQTEADAPTEKETEPVEEEPEPIVLTWFINEGNMLLGDGIHTDEVPVLQYIKDELGIEIDWVTFNADKYYATISAGELPDIVMVSDNPQGLIEGGQIIPLNDLLENHGQDILKRAETAIAAERTVYGGDEGECYMLPILIQTPNYDVPNGNGEGGLKIRMDIYQAIGSPSVETEEDFLNALKAMQDYERQRTGQDDIYALHMWGQGGTTTPQILARMYGNTDGRPFFLSDDETGEETFFLEKDSDYVKALRFYNKAWNMGILDPESFTMDATVWAEKLKTGKVLSSTTWGDQPDTSICGENAILAYAPGPFGYLPGAYFDYSVIGRGLYGAARAISSNCEYPERAMELLNWLDSDFGMRVIYNGVPGVDWDVIDGVPQFIGEAKAAFEAGEGSAYIKDRTMIGSDAVWYMASGNGTATEDGYPIRLTQSLEIRKLSATTAQINFASQYDPDFFYQGQVYDKWIKEGLVKTNDNEEVALIRAFMPALTTEQLENSVYPIITESYMNMSEIVMAEDDAAFDAIIDKWWQEAVEDGIEDVIKVVDQYYADTKELVQGMLGK